MISSEKGRFRSKSRFACYYFQVKVIFDCSISSQSSGSKLPGFPWQRLTPDISILTVTNGEIKHECN